MLFGGMRESAAGTEIEIKVSFVTTCCSVVGPPQGGMLTCLIWLPHGVMRLQTDSAPNKAVLPC